MRIVGRVFLSGLVFLSFAGCSPTTLEDICIEGESQVKKLAEELREIETKEALKKALPRIERRFLKIAELLIELEKMPHKERDPMEVSERLFIEMARLYEIPGGREMLESAQVAAIDRLRAPE